MVKWLVVVVGFFFFNTHLDVAGLAYYPGTLALHQVSAHKFSEPPVEVAGLSNIPGTLLTDSLAAVADILVREQRSVVVVVVVVVVVGTASTRMACKRGSQEVQRARDVLMQLLTGPFATAAAAGILIREQRSAVGTASARLVCKRSQEVYRWRGRRVE